MQCRDFCEVADSFLGDDLLIETNHDVITHLESCAGCRRELAARRELRKTLRASLGNAAELQIRDDYASRLHSELRAAAAQVPRRERLAAPVALLDSPVAHPGGAAGRPGRRGVAVPAVGHGSSW